MPDLTGNFNAKIWVEEWMKAIKENPTIPTDEDAMFGWFANAIMTGYDFHAKKQREENNEPNAKMLVHGK